MSKNNIDVKFKAAIPLEPIKSILEAFNSYNLVAIGEGTQHGDELGHAFLRTLISNPGFANTVNDIVVEWGNSLYQNIMDQYTQGGDVSADVLCQVWQNTTQPHSVWDSAVYEDFFKTVRKVNQSLSKEKKLRVLLGDPPIDWSCMKNKEDVLNFFNNEMLGRDTYPADLIQREVLNKNRRALIIYGGMHFQRKNIFSNYEECEGAETLISLLEKKGIKAFTIWGAADLERIQPDIASWKIPSLTLLRGTTLGNTDFAWYCPYIKKRWIINNGKPIFFSRDKWRIISIEEQFDAVMYSGPSSLITTSKIQPVTYSDSYMQMRLQRMSLANVPQKEINRLKAYYLKLKNRFKSD